MNSLGMHNLFNTSNSVRITVFDIIRGAKESVVGSACRQFHHMLHNHMNELPDEASVIICLLSLP